MTMTEQSNLSISELLQKAKNGDVQAQLDLACCWLDLDSYLKHENGKKLYKPDDIRKVYCGTDENYETLAIEWLKKSAEQGCREAQYFLAICYFGVAEIMGWFKTTDKVLGLQWLKKAAELNFPDAQLLMGNFYLEGLHSCEQNDELAFEWFNKAFKQTGWPWKKGSCMNAEYWLACCYLEGKNVGQNDAIAFEYLKKAAEHGHAVAQAKFACFYFEGKGVELNQELAFEWLKKAAERGEAEAQYRLALCYFEGKGVDTLCYFEGERVDISYEQGMKWLTEAAVEKNHTAANMLLENYKNDSLKFEGFKKAAEQGVVESKYRLALCYLEGRGVNKSYKEGMKWMIRAARESHEEANTWLTNAYISLVIPSCVLNKNNVEEYYKFAADWCLKEVDGHNAGEAYLLLGILYYSGKGVEQSDQFALEYLKKSLEASHDLFRGGENEFIFIFIELYLGNICAQGKCESVETYDDVDNIPYYRLDSLGRVFVDGLISMEFRDASINHKVFLTLLRLAVYKKAGEYEQAKEFLNEVFDKDKDMDKNLKAICLTGIEQEQEIAEKNKALQSEIKQKEALYKALHEKEKEMLSFFTHTMRNALATAPESLRQVIHLLGSEVYEKDTKHYQAINKIAALFSTLSLTDCLIDTFKQSISDPQEFKQSWQKDHTGEATPKWVIASALRQSLNRIIFMSGATELRKLLNSPETALIKATRKSFIEEVLPLNVDNQGVHVFYDWMDKHILAIDVSVADSDTLNFGVNQIRFSLLFAITSELILNALKYWDGENRIEINWQLAEQDNYVFSVKNHCKANATSNLAGTHKGLAFIKRLVELFGEQACFECKSEDQLFIAELVLNKTLFDGEP